MAEEQANSQANRVLDYEPGRRVLPYEPVDRSAGVDWRTLLAWIAVALVTGIILVELAFGLLFNGSRD